MTTRQGEKSNDGISNLDITLTHVKELVDKRDSSGKQEAEEPHAECVVGKRRVVNIY